MSQQMRILVVGAGSIGERHVRNFQETDRARVSLCEIDQPARARIARQYALSDVFDNFDTALDSQPHAAVICTPAHLHVPMATELARRGIHIFMEKPVSTSLDGINEFVAAVAQNNVVVAIAYIYRTHPALQAMRQAILDGQFGLPVQVVAVGGQHFPHYRPAYRQIYYANRATGGGAIQDALTHVINAAEWLVGPVTQVAADAAHQVLEGVDVEDSVHVIARHDSGDGRPVLASYSLNQHQAPNENSITVHCEHGTARLELHRKRWRWTTQPEESWHDEAYPELERDDLFIRQAHAFLDTFTQNKKSLCTLGEGVQTLRVNLAILQAVETMTWQSILAD